MKYSIIKTYCDSPDYHKIYRKGRNMKEEYDFSNEVRYPYVKKLKSR